MVLMLDGGEDYAERFWDGWEIYENVYELIHSKRQSQ